MKYTFIIDYQDNEKRDAHIEAKMDGEGSDKDVLMELCTMPYFLGNIYGGIAKKIIGCIDAEERDRKAIADTFLNSSATASIKAGFNDAFLGKEADHEQE